MLKHLLNVDSYKKQYWIKLYIKKNVKNVSSFILASQFRLFIIRFTNNLTEFNLLNYILQWVLSCGYFCVSSNETDKHFCSLTDHTFYLKQNIGLLRVNWFTFSETAIFLNLIINWLVRNIQEIESRNDLATTLDSEIPNWSVINPERLFYKTKRGLFWTYWKIKWKIKSTFVLFIY